MSKHSLKRRLRIRTLQYGMAGNINELYDSVDSEVVLSILVQKVNSSQLPSLGLWHGLFYILGDERSKS